MLAGQVYRLYDGDGRLLYVGVSTALRARFNGHSASSGFWGDVRRIEIEDPLPLKRAYQREAEVTAAEQPVWNVNNRAGHRADPIPGMTTTEAAVALGVHPATLLRWANAGLLPCRLTPGRHRRFRQSDLENFRRRPSRRTRPRAHGAGRVTLARWWRERSEARRIALLVTKDERHALADQVRASLAREDAVFRAEL